MSKNDDTLERLFQENGVQEATVEAGRMWEGFSAELGDLVPRMSQRDIFLTAFAAGAMFGATRHIQILAEMYAVAEVDLSPKN